MMSWRAFHPPLPPFAMTAASELYLDYLNGPDIAAL